MEGVCGIAPARLRGTQERPKGLADLRLVHSSWDAQREGSKREAMLTALQEIMPYNDFVAVSFYPFIRGGTTDYEGCFRWLRDHFDGFKKPYAVVETGEPAQRLKFPKSGQVIDGTPEKQEAYFKALLAFAQENNVRFVIGFIHRDYDALWEKIKGTTPEAFMAWRDCGLIDEDGSHAPPTGSGSGISRCL